MEIGRLTEENQKLAEKKDIFSDQVNIDYCRKLLLSTNIAAYFIFYKHQDSAGHGSKVVFT